MPIELHNIPNQPNPQQASDKVMVSDQTSPDGTGYRTREELLALLQQVATVLQSGDKVLFTDGSSANTRYRILPNMAILDGNNALQVATNQDENTAVMALSNTAAAINVFVSDDTPIGAITGINGDLCITKNGAATQIYQHIGAVSNVTDWSVIQRVSGACGGVESGGVAVTDIVTTGVPVLGNYTLVPSAQDFNFSYAGQTYTYTGATSTEIRHANVQCGATKVSGSEVEYEIFIYRKRGAGVFEQIGAGGISSLKTIDPRTLVTSVLMDLQNGDEFQIWTQANVGTTDITMINTFFTVS